jgi:hypothetical protein
MQTDWVTGDGWWRIFRFAGLTHPRACNGDYRKYSSQSVTCHPTQCSRDLAAGVRRAGNIMQLARAPRGQKNFGVNPMNRDLSERLAQMNDTPRCGAKTRAGSRCRCPAMPNGKCRIHGGLSPGAPRGAANGNYRDGYWTREAVEERKFIRSLVKDALVDRP